MSLYLPAFIASFFLTTFSLIVMIIALYRFPRLLSLFRVPIGLRHLDSRRAVRCGGIAIAVGFFGAIFFEHRLVIDAQTEFFLIGALLFTLWGLLDDFFALSWRIQLLLQFATAVLIGSLGVRILGVDFMGWIDFSAGSLFDLLGVLSLSLTVLWIVGLLNALNWSDGVDGLAGGVVVIAGFTLFSLSLREEVYQPPIAILCAALFGAALSFTLFNIARFTPLRLPFRFIAGSSGSYMMGYTLAVLAIFSGAKIGTALLVMIVPLVDALSVIYDRARSGVSLFRGDARHFHHILMSHGWSTSRILMLYYGLTLFGSSLALTTQSTGKITAFILYAFVLFFVISFVRKKTL